LFVQTLIPIYICFFVLLVAIVRFRHLLLNTFWLSVFFGGILFILGPSITDWEPLGHSSQYVPYFMGASVPGSGDTLSYPAMQLWWWVWGLFLPDSSEWMLLVSLLFGGLGVAATALFMYRLMGFKAAAVVAVWLLSHPLTIQWSHSVYNIIFPFSFFALSTAVLVKPKANRWDYSTVAALLTVACAMRLEWALAPVLIGVVLLFSGKKASLWVPSFVLGSLLVGIACFPLLSSLPGDGERVNSFFNHVSMTFFWMPYDGLLGATVMLGAAVLAFNRNKSLTIALCLSCFCTHLMMSTFDDYGTRHTFVILFCMGALVSMASLHRWGFGVLAGVAVLHGGGIGNFQKRFYASPEDMAHHMAESEFKSLPSTTLQKAHLDGCAWIAEEYPFEGSPTRSHFNLLNLTETNELMIEYGCIDWCWGLEDWRINALSVRDRWMKLQNMYTFTSLDQVNQGDSSCYRQRLDGRRSSFNFVWISRSW